MRVLAKVARFTRFPKVPSLLGLILLSLSSSSAWSNPMTFEFLDRCLGEMRACNPRVLARGDIDFDSAAELRRFIGRHFTDQPRSNWHGLHLCFDSEGGDLEAALALGDVIQQFRLDTCMEPQYLLVRSGHDGTTSESTEVLSPQPVCFSACVFALAAGTHRSVAKGSRVGVHQFYGVGRDLGQRLAQMTMTVLGRYLDGHGVDRKLLDIASTNSPRWMRLLTAEEIVSLGLDNTTPIYDSWKLRVSDTGVVYARVEQRNPLTDSRTGLVLYRENGLKIDVLFYPGSFAVDECGDSSERRGKQPLRGLQGALDSAEIWLRGDEEDLMSVPKGNWTHGADGAFLRTVVLREQELDVLRSRQLLEVWVLVSHADCNVNPTMAFRLDSLRPFLKILSR
jgi:hypothetical protein